MIQETGDRALPKFQNKFSFPACVQIKGSLDLKPLFSGFHDVWLPSSKLKMLAVKNCLNSELGSLGGNAYGMYGLLSFKAV